MSTSSKAQDRSGDLHPGAPYPDAPPDSVEVETFSRPHTADGICCLLQKCVDGRCFPTWFREEELEPLSTASFGGPLPTGFPLTAQLPDSVTLKERTRFLLIHTYSANTFQCRASFRNPEMEVELTGGLIEAMILALHTEAPLFITEQTLAIQPPPPPTPLRPESRKTILTRKAQARQPPQYVLPEGWIVTSDLAPEREIRIATAPRTAAELFGVLLFVAIIAATTAWAGYGRVHHLFILGVIALLGMVEPLLWWMFGQESWRLAPNALERRRSFLGISWGRRLVGGTLIVTYLRSMWGDQCDLIVEERGRRRKLLRMAPAKQVWAMGEFVSRYTGWPLQREE